MCFSDDWWLALLWQSLDVKRAGLSVPPPIVSRLAAPWIERRGEKKETFLSIDNWNWLYLMMMHFKIIRMTKSNFNFFLISKREKPNVFFSHLTAVSLNANFRRYSLSLSFFLSQSVERWSVDLKTERQLSVTALSKSRTATRVIRSAGREGKRDSRIGCEIFIKESPGTRSANSFPFFQFPLVFFLSLSLLSEEKK